MGNELFSEIQTDAWKIASSIELFHNFTLIHDDIMDKAPMRRGSPTVHSKYNESSALLAGDVMLLQAYDYLNETDPRIGQNLIRLLNQTGKQVCEGQQLDMDFEKMRIRDFNRLLAYDRAENSSASGRQPSDGCYCWRCRYC